jgi:hypothetical protein
MEKGYRLVSEDITATDGRMAFSCPYTNSWADNSIVRRYLIEKGIINTWSLLKSHIAEYIRIPFITHYISVRTPLSTNFTFLTTKFNKKDVKDLFLTNANIRKIIILKRSKVEKVDNIDEQDAIREILICNRNEHRYYQDGLIVALGAYYDKFDIYELMLREKEIIKLLVKNTTCYIVKGKVLKVLLN